MSETKHWSKVEYLHETVRNPNIHVKGTHSYYSPAWTEGFEASVVRYHYGDDYSLEAWKPQWPIDQLVIGDYVCISAEVVILMGGNNTHRLDWFSCYPHEEFMVDSYVGKGDTILGDGCWVGMRAMLLPGTRLGEGTVVAANSVVSGEIEPYTVVAGNPAQTIRRRFSIETIDRLLALRFYEWPEEKFDALRRFLCHDSISRLEEAAFRYDAGEAHL